MNFIDGAWQSAADDASYARRNPADERDLIGVFPDSGGADARVAAMAAAAAFPGWRDALPQERAGVLHRAAEILRDRVDAIALTLTREEGKPVGNARGEVLRAADALEYFGALALSPTGSVIPSTRKGTTVSTRHPPLGVILAITPFNFPLFVTALKLGPAIATGNTCVWKPSPHTPLTSVALVDALNEAGLPHGVVNLVFGGSPALGRDLIEQPTVQAISFTGSTIVGLEVGRLAAVRHVRVQQEMGGKNVLFVTKDFDIGAAAQIACDSTFGESGQKCTAAGLVVVPDDVLDAFLDNVSRVVARLAVGDGREPGVAIGPLIDGAAIQRANKMVDESIDQGDECVIDGGGRVVGNLTNGHFMRPMVVRLNPDGSPLSTKEVFAPIMAIRVVTGTGGLDAALEILNSIEYGLAASILTNNLRDAAKFVDHAPVGMVSVNLPTTGVEYQAPFGGWGLSGGLSPEAGPSAVNFYTRSKTIAITGAM